VNTDPYRSVVTFALDVSRERYFCFRGYFSNIFATALFTPLSRFSGLAFASRSFDATPRQMIDFVSGSAIATTGVPVTTSSVRAEPVRLPRYKGPPQPDDDPLISRFFSNPAP